MLSRLEARGFRNLEPLEIELGRGVHLILGPNGAGKTSLLEAIYVLATTRSFRTPRLADCCRHGVHRFDLAGEVETTSRTRLELAWDAGGAKRAVNGNRATLADHLAVLPVVAWTSENVELLIGSPAERRRFLDRGVVGTRPRALEVLSRYRRALDEKRRLLHRRALPGELESWNDVLAAAAVELVRLRARYAEQLARALGAVLERSALGIPEIEVRYRSSPPDGGDTTALAAALESAADEERRQLRPLVGPHRDELELRWAGRPIRRVASAGERKALGLALMAAHGEVLAAAGRAPTYLLDDVDIELDRDRLEALWHVLGEAPQLVATSNRPWVWETIEVERRWRSEAGRLAPSE